MTTKEEIGPPVVKPPLLTSRQLATAAVFGGLGFAWRGLGLIIPLVPPFVFDLRAVFWVIGAASSGPYGAIIIGILHGLPARFPPTSIVCVALYGLIFLVFYKVAYYLPSPWRYLLTYFAILLATFIGDVELVWGAYITGVAPFWPFFVAWFTTGYWVWRITEIVAITVMMRFAPEFIEPTWSWRRPKARI